MRLGELERGRENEGTRGKVDLLNLQCFHLCFHAKTVMFIVLIKLEGGALGIFVSR